MARLAALQPRSVDELFAEWAAAADQGLEAARAAVDPAAASYDDRLFRGWLAFYQRHLMGKIAEAGALGVDLLLLPENTLPTGALKKASLRDLALEVFRWSSGDFLSELAGIARAHQMAVGSCLNYVDDGRLVNAGVLTNERGEIAGIYHKTHLPSPEDELVNSSEAASLSAGSTYPVFETKVGRVGFQICYDIDFPEPSRILALQGADVILHPSAGYNFPDEEELVGEARLRVRAAENSVALVYSNFAVRRLTYSGGGRSCVIDARGTMVACAGRGEGLAMADVEIGAPRMPGWVRPGYEHREHIWRKRRPETYRLLTDLHPPVLDELHEARQAPLYHYRDDVGLP